MLFFPVIGVAVLLDILDRTIGTQFFAAATGDPIAYQHLFWIFGHPEVYILILPVWGIVGDLLSFFSRKPAFLYRGTVLSLVAITVLSALVYGHHMFVAGLSPMLGKAFMTFSLLIPAAVGAPRAQGLAQLPVAGLEPGDDSDALRDGGGLRLLGGGLDRDLPGNHVDRSVLSRLDVGRRPLSLHPVGGLVAGSLLRASSFWFPKMLGRLASTSALGQQHFWVTFPA